MKGFRNWLEMPDEVMANILGRLNAVEILNSARKVCTTWRRICKDPAMWKVIDIYRSDANCVTDYVLNTLATEAVDLSCGELPDITLDGFASMHLLDRIVHLSSKLKSVCLWDCYNIAGSELTRALKRVPQLEKLDLSYTSYRAEYVDDIITNCPQLKSFKLDKVFIRVLAFVNDNDALAIAKNMSELRHLQLYGNLMTNKGLEAILNGCPHLESLDIRTCYNICLDGNLGKRCTEHIKNFKGPHDSMENCGFYPRIHEFEEYDDNGDNLDEDDSGYARRVLLYMIPAIQILIIF